MSSNSGSGGGGGGGGGHWDPNAFAAVFAKRTEMNLEAMQYYAAAVCGLMGVFVLLHLVRAFSQRTRINRAAIFAPFMYLSRISRRKLLPRFSGLPSRAHALIASAYIGINIIVAFTHIDLTGTGTQSTLASRFGWMAVSNMVIVVFLALKNTPLSFISAWSYERINALHRVAGSVTMVIVILHACTYASYFGNMDNLKRLRVNEEIFGMCAAFCMLAAVFAATVIRRFWYEVFYALHVFFFMATVVFIGLHQPEVVKKIVTVVGIVGGLWVLDRAVRFARLVYYSCNNEATVYPLTNGGTRVVLRKGPRGGSVAGSHCFVWIPGIRFFEMHPFTVVSGNSMEFVVSVHDGFTRDLHTFALANSGRTLMASVEGPYGKFPNPASYDRVIMFAGGSGASFTIGMALRAVEVWKDGKVPITFHWMVRQRGYFAWFADYIGILQASGKMSMNLHVTGNTPPPTPKRSSPYIDTPPRSTTPIMSLDKETGEIEEKVESSHSSVSHSERTTPCPGNCGAHQVCLNEGIEITEGRPDVGQLVREEVAKTARRERILVLGCGPVSLMDDVRNATAASIQCEGPAIELHCEQFGW